MVGKAKSLLPGYHPKLLSCKVIWCKSQYHSHTDNGDAIVKQALQKNRLYNLFVLIENSSLESIYISEMFQDNFLIGRMRY